ncbi:MAG: ATP-binding protein [Dehalococcoidia bacterium]
MPDLPTGAVTLLFTDIEGSTQLLRRLGDRYTQALAEHHRLLRHAFAAHDGHEVDNQCDSFFVAFALPLDAVLAAGQAQQALFSHPWPEGGAVRVRMGLHTGEPLLSEDRDRYLGLDVHQAARIEAAAHGGQVLLSRATAELVQDRLPEGLELRQMGEHRLKDFEQPQPLFQLLLQGLPASFPPLRTAREEPEAEILEAGRGTGLAALVGRTEELALLRERLQAARTSRGSLVLLAGEPGIGKTRLAEELAGEAREQGVTVLWGRCWEGEGAPPFYPWLQFLQTYSEQQPPLTLRAELGSGAAELAQLLPELRERLPDLPSEAAGSRVGEQSAGDPEAARFRLFQAVSRLLLNAAQARPLVLLLDDRHWADKASLLLLQFLSRELGKAKLLVIGTYRDTDLDRRHPLAETLPSLRRTPAFERILVHGLSREEVERLLTVRTGQQPAAGAAWTSRWFAATPSPRPETRPIGGGAAPGDGGQSLLHRRSAAPSDRERQVASARWTLDRRRGEHRRVGHPGGRAGGDRQTALAAQRGDEPAADAGLGHLPGVRHRGRRVFACACR